MFSSAEQIKNRSGKNKVGRFAFLKQLLEEFRATSSTDSKHQVLANFANFAYDPINYEHLRTLGIVDLFLEQLSEDDPILVNFAVGGLCNLALDGENKAHINGSGGISQVSRCLLESTCASTIIYAITTLMFLVTDKYKAEIISDTNVQRMLELADYPDKRVQNLATIFLEDYCSKDQVHRIRSRSNLQDIPMPTQDQDSKQNSQCSSLQDIPMPTQENAQ